MQELLTACIVFTVISFYVLFLDNFAHSPVIILKTLAFPIIIVFLTFYIGTKTSWKNLNIIRNKWYILILGTTIIQLLVLSTGSINSPFLILIHFFMIVISLVFDFAVSLLFLAFSFIVILFDLFFVKNIWGQIYQNPTPYILQLISLIPIISIAYLISQHYHSKEKLSRLLHDKVLTDEAILSNLDELVIITDPQLHILSVNDAVERTLQLSSAELLNKPIFDVLLLRDNDDKLVTEASFSFKENLLSKKITDDFILFGTTLPPRKITLHIQPVKDIQNNISQLSFIINPETAFPSDMNDTVIGKARTTYEAIFADFKNKIEAQNIPDIQKQMLILEKLESDIYQVQTLRQSQSPLKYAKFDIAQLSKQTVQAYKKFASAFSVPLEFAIRRFGEKDIAPLTVSNYPVKPEDLTGPFFTVENDVKHTQIILKKLLEIAIFMASSEQSPFVVFSVEREGKEFILIKISASCPVLTNEELKNLYIPFYGPLNNKTNLSLSSGLEGYLINTLSRQLAMPLTFTNKPKSTSTITFSLKIKKKINNTT